MHQSRYWIYFSGFGESALEVMVYFFFDVQTWVEEIDNRHKVYLELLRLADELGVSFAFPTRTLHLATRAKEKELPAPRRPDEEALTASVLAFGPGGALARPHGPSLVEHGFVSGFRQGGEQAPHQGDDPDADLGDTRE